MTTHEPPFPEGEAGEPPRDTTSGYEMLKLRPAHVVIFRERSERNAGRLSAAINARPALAGGLRDSVDLLKPHLDHLPHTRVYHQLGVAVGSFSPDQIESLKGHADVASVELNAVRRLPTLRMGLQVTAGVQAEGNAGQGLTWCLSAIGVSVAAAAPTGKGVKLAILDTGLDFDHPDFLGRVDVANSKGFVPGVHGAEDDHGHGTHCAGIAAGPMTPHGGGARYGVAPDVELLVGKVLDKHETGTDDNILDGIDWAVNMGSRVISMSLGTPRSVDGAYSVAYETIARSIQRDGAQLICAAGNDSVRDQYTRPVNNPAACPNLVAVAALDRFNRVAPYSASTMDSIGVVDISAPGDGVESSWLDGLYRSLSGTSMATPHVAGAAALLLQLDPTLKPTEVIAQLNGLANKSNLSTADAGSGLLQCPAP